MNNDLSFIMTPERTILRLVEKKFSGDKPPRPQHIWRTHYQNPATPLRMEEVFPSLNNSKKEILSSNIGQSSQLTTPSR